MNVTVVGMGYVGLVSAACFAKQGHRVTGVEIDAHKVEMLKAAKSPIYEPGLEDLLKEVSGDGSLTFTTDLKEALPNTDILLSAVATPPDGDHKADLTAIFSVADAVAEHATKDLIFVNKSTVPVGTGKKCEERIKAALEKRGATISIPVVSNPEFLREGQAVRDTLEPERIVVGANGDKVALEKMHELYQPHMLPSHINYVEMSRESAELVKYASNAFLATKISFINMLGELAEKTGADIQEIAFGMGLDSRIGKQFLNAGIGYGGSCFPKDVRALMATAKEYNVPLPIADATDAINTHQRKRFAQKILSTLSTPSHIAVWGLSFKPNTDDMRDAPSLDIIPTLLSAGHTVTAYDPAAMERARALLPDSVVFADSAMNALNGADALVVLTEWKEFAEINEKEIANTLQGNQIFDGRNTLDSTQLQANNIVYHGMGRQK